MRVGSGWVPKPPALAKGPRPSWAIASPLQWGEGKGVAFSSVSHRVLKSTADTMHCISTAKGIKWDGIFVRELSRAKGVGRMPCAHQWTGRYARARKDVQPQNTSTQHTARGSALTRADQHNEESHTSAPPVGRAQHTKAHAKACKPNTKNAKTSTRIPPGSRRPYICSSCGSDTGVCSCRGG